MYQVNFSYQVNQPVALVFDYLTNLQQFASVHPVISKIVPLKNNNYLVYETLKLGLIPLSFTYPVSIEQKEDQKQVRMKATVMKITTVTMTFSLRSDNGLTIVDEEIIFRSPLPGQSILAGIFKKQHTLLFKNISAL